MLTDDFDGNEGDIGGLFEKTVAQHYEALGYKVEKNVLLDGHQIDLVISKFVPGADHLTYAVEAKYRKSGYIGINHVTNFETIILQLTMKGIVNGGIFVSNAEFWRTISIKEKSNIKYITIEQLENELFNSTESLVRCKIDYEKKDISKEYMPIKSVHKRDSGANEIIDTAEYVLNWADNEKSFLFVIGDFGTGKSTILDRVFYDVTLKRLKSEYGKFPIRLRLRNLLRHPSLWSFVESEIREQYLAPTKGVFDSRLNNGQLVILLDGFDEIKTGATSVDRAKYLKILSPLISSPSPCVISTRPTYFESLNQMIEHITHVLNKGMDFERIDPKLNAKLNKTLSHLNIRNPENLNKKDFLNVVSLTPPDEEWVDSYLRKFEVEIRNVTGQSVDYVKSCLYKIYDLKDILQRPLLISMVVSVITKSELDITRDDISIGPATLYEIYTQMCADRDHVKHEGYQRQLLSKEERLKSCQEIAVTMLDKSVKEVTAGEILAVAERVQPEILKRTRTDRQEMLERILTDIRICSFLAFDDSGVLQFAHRSFFEFFVAQHIVVRMAENLNAIAIFSKKSLNKEIIEFLGSYVRDKSDIANYFIRAYKNKQEGDSEVQKFAARVALSSGSLLESMPLENVTIRDSQLKRAETKNAKFNRVTLQNVRFEDLRAQSWSLTQCVTKDSFAQNVSLLDSEIDLNVSNLTVEKFTFDSCDSTIRGSGLQGENVSFSRGRLNLSVQGVLSDSTFTDVERINIEETAKIEFRSSSHFSRCSVIQGHLTSFFTNYGVLKFSDCTLIGLAITENDALELISDDRKNSNISFLNCRGIVVIVKNDALVAKKKDPISREFLKLLSRKHPDIHFIREKTLDLGMKALLNRSSNVAKTEESLDALNTLRKLKVSRYLTTLSPHPSGWIRNLMS